ncbi:MAG: hypothetical protein ACKOAX_11185, partial [Candidatus Kapaibacterium sp.]
ITCNKNAVPYDTQSPLITSGIRLGSAAMTSRGMKEPDMRQIADFIDRVIADPTNDHIKMSVKDEVRDFCRTFPLYAEYDRPMEELKSAVGDAVKSLVGNVGSVLSKVGDEMRKASTKQ